MTVNINLGKRRSSWPPRLARRAWLALTAVPAWAALVVAKLESIDAGVDELLEEKERASGALCSGKPPQSSVATVLCLLDGGGSMSKRVPIGERADFELSAPGWLTVDSGSAVFRSVEADSDGRPGVALSRMYRVSAPGVARIVLARPEKSE